HHERREPPQGDPPCARSRRPAGAVLDHAVYVGVQRTRIDRARNRRGGRHRAGVEEQRRSPCLRSWFDDPADRARHGHDDRYHERVATPSAGMTAALSATGLSKRYDGRLALDDASLAIGPGEFVAVLGASGAGKTTLFRCLTRLTEPDAGQIEIG